MTAPSRPPAPQGRGTGLRPKGRFERIEVDRDAEEEAEVGHPTSFLRDASRSVLVRNDSPDVPFEWSLNPYRGCEHGCAYCYARPTHEYLGFSAGLDFETKILVKEDAPRLLEEALARGSWVPTPVALSGVTDPYQPVERRLGVTRGCLEILERCRHPVTVVTKNHLVTRDADLLASLARHGAAAVALSITTLSGELAADLEPRASHPRRRLEAVRVLADAGVPVGVLVAPLIPGLTDHELPAILEAASAAGATWGTYLLLRLPGAVEEIFVDWPSRERPLRHDRVLSRLRDLRGGALSDPRFGSRMRGEGVWARQLREILAVSCRRLGLGTAGPELSSAAFRRPGAQLELFGNS